VPLIFCNHGNLGLPLCLFAFGEQGLALAVIFFTVISFFHYTVGISVVSRYFSLMGVVRSPIILATLLAVMLIVLDLDLPLWVQRTTKLIGDLTIPLMLVSLGVSLASFNFGALRSHSLLACSRIVIGFGCALLVSYLFALEGVVRGVLVLQAAMPSAIFNYLLALKYGKSADDVAGVVAVSTIFSFVSLPFLIGYLLP
jgi:predicted permease